MSLSAAIVPFGPDYEVRGRRVSGVFACLQCREFMRVAADKAGVIHFYCDATLTDEKCGLQLKNVIGPLPDDTAADLHRYADEIRAMRPEVRAAYARSWGLTIQHVETILVPGSQEVSEPATQQHRSDDDAARPVRPVYPAGPTRDAGPADPAEKPGKPAGNPDAAGTTGEPRKPSTQVGAGSPAPDDTNTGPDERTSGRPWTAKFFPGSD